MRARARRRAGDMLQEGLQSPERVALLASSLWLSVREQARLSPVARGWRSFSCPASFYRADVRLLGLCPFVLHGPRFAEFGLASGAIRQWHRDLAWYFP